MSEAAMSFLRGFFPQQTQSAEPAVLRKGRAMRVIFFYPGEEGTYVENADVTLYGNGIVQIRTAQEETTAHLQNLEILWKFQVDAEDRASKFRLLKIKESAAPEIPPERPELQ